MQRVHVLVSLGLLVAAGVLAVGCLDDDGDIINSGGTGTPCQRTAPFADTTYGFLGQDGEQSCRTGFRCFALPGEVRGKCAPSQGCSLPPGPYANGYYEGAPYNPRECTGDTVCIARALPPLGTNYYGQCLPRTFLADAGSDAATDAGGPPQPLTCEDAALPAALTHTPGKAIDYLVTCNLPVERALTIGPGTVIAFKSNSSFQVRGAGSLKAVGSATAPIVMQSDSAGGTWVGVYFFTKAPENTLEFVRIKGAGEQQPNLQASVLVGAESYADGSVAIRDCVIEASAGPGLAVGAQGVLTAFERTSITGGAKAPVITTLRNIGALASGNKLTGNAVGRVEIQEASGTPADADQTWSKLDVPYYVMGNVRYAGKQTLSPGVTVLMGPDAALQAAGQTAKLIAVGTATERIEFRSEDNQPGKWAGLLLTGGLSNELAHCRIAGGGLRGITESKGNVLAYAAEVSIRDCVIEGSASWGVFNAGGTVKLGPNVTFNNNAKGDLGGDP